MIKANTPIGRLFADVKGTEAEYPGIEFGIATDSGDVIYLGMVEWDTVKEKLQVVVYNDPDSADNPSDIIELNNVMKDLED